MSKTTGTIEIEFPISCKEFERHRKFHYLYPERHNNGKRIVSNMTFWVWFHDDLYRVRAESVIQRVKARRAK